MLFTRYVTRDPLNARSGAFGGAILLRRKHVKTLGARWKSQAGDSWVDS